MMQSAAPATFSAVQIAVFPVLPVQCMQPQTDRQCMCDQACVRAAYTLHDQYRRARRVAH